MPSISAATPRTTSSSSTNSTVSRPGAGDPDARPASWPAAGPRAPGSAGVPKHRSSGRIKGSCIAAVSRLRQGRHRHRLVVELAAPAAREGRDLAVGVEPGQRRPPAQDLAHRLDLLLDALL